MRMSVLLDGFDMGIIVDSRGTIETVMDKIHDMVGIPPDQQRFFVQGESDSRFGKGVNTGFCKGKRIGFEKGASKYDEGKGFDKGKGIGFGRGASKYDKGKSFDQGEGKAAGVGFDFFGNKGKSKNGPY